MGIKRKKQYYEDETGLWTYLIKGVRNPCGCGSNCYHQEYDGKNIICVCNACGQDIYEIKEDHIEDMLNTGVWMEE